MASSSALRFQSFPIGHPHSATSNRLHEPPTSVGGCSSARTLHAVFMSPQRQLGVPKAPAHPASFQRTSSMFLKACSNMVVISKRPRCGLLLRPSLGINAVLAPNAHSSTRIVFIALVWLCGRVPCLSHGYSAKVRRPTCAFICVTAASEITSLRPSV